MEHFNGINAVKFDYGGTIDSRGVHWSEVIWDGYVRANVPVSKSDFRECYVFAERELARVKHIYPEHNFHDMLLIKMRIELENLVSAGKIGSERIDEWVKDIAGYCYGCAKDSVEEARPVLEALHARFPMVLVSNFYGNVETVLADFDLRKYFKEIIESAVVGVRKPDPKIFMLGVEALGMSPEEVVVVGDSYKKDIVPAESLGCRVLWLKGKGWTDEEDRQQHPNIIKKLSDMLDVVL